jgi:hypothetical protein
MDFIVNNRTITPVDDTMQLTVQRDTLTEIATFAFNKIDLDYFYESGVTHAYAIYKPQNGTVQPPKICDIDESDTEKIIVTWEIDETATVNSGITEFQIIFAENDPTDDTINTVWATLIYKLKIPRSLLAEDVSADPPTPLIIEQMLEIANRVQETTYTKTEIDDMIGDIETLLAAI